MAKYRDHIDQALFERIEAYILNTMDNDSRLAFEQEMSADAVLRNEVALQQKMIAAIEVRAHYDEVKTEAEQPHPVHAMKKYNRIGWYAAAAVVTIVVTWFFQNNPSPKDIYTAYFTADDGLPVVMSGTHEDYSFYNGMISYKEGNYSEAIEIWKSVNKNSDTLQYYRGAAYLNNNQAAQAIEYLLPLAKDYNTTWQQKAIWYLSLAYLKQGNKTETITWLIKLKDDHQAVQLLKTLQESSP